MRRLAVAALGCALLLAAEAVPLRSEQPGDAFDRLYRSYESGDYGVILRTLRTENDFINIRPDLFSAVGRWKTDWHRRHVTFLLDLATLGLSYEWFSPVDPLTAGRDLVRKRPTSIGASADDDRFEVTYHKAAVALLLAASYPDAADAYLDNLRDRVSPSPAPGRLIEPRIVLQRAMAAEIRTRPILVTGSLNRKLETAVTGYDAAAKFPPNKAEALARRAFVMLRLERPAEAVGTLDQIPQGSADTDVAYWAALTRGRAEEALGRTDAAIASYRVAASAHPGAQSAAAALSMALLRTNQPEEARRWADSALGAPTGTIDPWWRYWAADRRLLFGWLTDLRGMSR